MVRVRVRVRAGARVRARVRVRVGAFLACGLGAKPGKTGSEVVADEEDATGEACEKARCPDRHNP